MTEWRNPKAIAKGITLSAASRVWMTAIVATAALDEKPAAKAAIVLLIILLIDKLMTKISLR
jgi:hypothetical protein